MDQQLRELWDRIDTGHPPVAALVTEGERSKRRRRHWMAGGMAATLIVAVVAGGAIVDAVNDKDAGVADAVAQFPAPPEGMRWVGLGQVVVAVPDWWTTGETQCLEPVEDTVYFDQGAVADCQDPPSPATVREVSALAVLDATTGYGEYITRSMDPLTEVDGHAVLERAECEEWFKGVCRHLFAVPSEGVTFAVTVTDDGGATYEDIRDSLRILPDDLTTVPLATTDGWTPTWGAEPVATDALVAALENAGLEVEIEKVERPDDDAGGGDYVSFPAGSLLDVSPALGSLIEVGGTVTVTVAGESLAQGD